jgi:transcriptional regulator with XRE-family HTH domain
MRNPDRREHRIGIPLPYLYDWRVSQLITQEDLGKRAGISGSAISQIEGALVNASFGSVRRLADALGITVDNVSLGGVKAG